MQEVAQSVTTKAEDDFLGFNSVPLVNIQAHGLESWFKLRTSHSLQVSWLIGAARSFSDSTE